MSPQDAGRVRVAGVSKAFPRRFGAATLRLQHAGPSTGQDVALADVTFDVGAGECVALLGTRRSGRTTMLRTIQGVFSPDAGHVLVRGRIGGLVAMGVGFSPALRVRDCLTLNGALLGASPEELGPVVPDVLAFAGEGPKVLGFRLRDLPGPRRRRLAYGLALHLPADVMLADGVVTFGDDAMQEAGATMLERHREAGAALVLATNRAPLVRRLCTRAVVLDAGRVVHDGPVGPGLRRLRKR